MHFQIKYFNFFKNKNFKFWYRWKEKTQLIHIEIFLQIFPFDLRKIGI